MKYLENYKIFEMKRNIEKVDFEWNGFKFKNISLSSWGRENTENITHYATIGAVSQVVRQYIKQKWGVPFQISSESYAGGDSIRVYFSPLEISEEQYDEISKDLKSTFQEGNFNAMEDIYEYSGTKCFVDINGRKIEFGTKYFFTEYAPKWGTKKYDEWKNKTEVN